MGIITPGQLAVASTDRARRLDLRGRHGADHPPRQAEDQRPRRHHHPRPHDRPGADDALLADVATGQEPRADPDQGAGPDADAVQHRRMTRDDARLHDLRRAVVAVDDHPVLKVDRLAQDDRRHVAAYYHPVPQIDPRRKSHVAGHDGV
jgi:hypothetical protein